MTHSSHQIEEVCELLLASIPEVFGTMLNTEMAPGLANDFESSGESRITGSVGFMGEINGVVHLHMTAVFARLLASRLLDMPEEEIESDELIDDAIGEISNMVVGAVKSRLCDEGFPCMLTIPTIIRGPAFSVGAAGFSDRRSLAFRSGSDPVGVDLQMKPAAG